MLPLRGTLRSWRNRVRGTSWSSTQGYRKPCAVIYAGGHPNRKQLYRKSLRGLVDTRMNTSHEPSLKAKKADGILGCTGSSVCGRWREGILLLYSGLLSSYLEYCLYSKYVAILVSSGLTNTRKPWSFWTEFSEGPVK